MNVVESLTALGLSGEALIPLLVGLVLLWGFVRVVNSPDNPVEWWHFIATHTESGDERGDVNSLGMLAGVVSCVFVVAWTTYKNNAIDFLTLGVCLIYLGGVKVAAAYLRSLAAQKLGVAAPPDGAGTVERTVKKSEEVKTTEKK